MFATVSSTTDWLLFPPSCPRWVCFSPLLVFSFTLSLTVCPSPSQRFIVSFFHSELSLPLLKLFFLNFQNNKTSENPTLVQIFSNCAQTQRLPSSRALDTLRLTSCWEAETLAHVESASCADSQSDVILRLKAQRKSTTAVPAESWVLEGGAESKRWQKWGGWETAADSRGDRLMALPHVDPSDTSKHERVSYQHVASVWEGTASVIDFWLGALIALEIS